MLVMAQWAMKLTMMATTATMATSGDDVNKLTHSLNFGRLAQAQELLHNTLDVLQALLMAAVAARWCSNALHAITGRGRKEGKWNLSTHRFNL